MEKSSKLVQVQITIFGDVQGIGFRYNVVEIARDLGLVGWVRNREDGAVEIVAEGPKKQLENFVTWAKQGSPLAKVESSLASWRQSSGEFSGFEVRY